MHTLPTEVNAHLKASWIQTKQYARYEDAYEHATNNIEALRMYRIEKANMSTSLMDKTGPFEKNLATARTTIKEDLEADLFELATGISSLYKATPTLEQMAIRRAEATFNASLELLEASIGTCLATKGPINDIGPRHLTSPFPEITLSEKEPHIFQETFENLEPDNKQEMRSLAEMLEIEARELLPHLYLALLPALDPGARLKNMSTITISYTTATAYRRSIDRLEARIAELNPL